MKLTVRSRVILFLLTVGVISGSCNYLNDSIKLSPLPQPYTKPKFGKDQAFRMLLIYSSRRTRLSPLGRGYKASELRGFNAPETDKLYKSVF